MDEKRQYFRLDNLGEVQAYLSDGHSLDVINISASGIKVINNHAFPQQGNIEVIIRRIKYMLHYEQLKSDEEGLVLTFHMDSVTDNLFMALRQLRDERRLKG